MDKEVVKMDIKIFRRCEKCNIRLTLAEELIDRIHVICQKCGKVYIFFKNKCKV